MIQTSPSAKSRAAGANLQTVRYYKRRALITQPPKPASGYRRYGVDTTERIRFIKRAQGFGFRLDEIRELLTLGDSHCDDVRTWAILTGHVVTSTPCFMPMSGPDNCESRTEKHSARG